MAFFWAWLSGRKFSVEVPIRGRGGAGVEAENLAGVNLTHLFAADLILPVQVLYRPAERWLHRLCLAILEDALKYLGVHGGYGGRRACARQRYETWEWFLSDADYCFSFTTVCLVLNLNVEAVRR